MEPTVLVVDDDPNAAALLTAALRGESCRVDRVGSCAEARRRLTDALPSVLVVEPSLPDGSGWELIAELRQRQGARLPVIVSTADSRPGASEARGLGIRWMTKPFHLRQARMLLTRLLRAAHSDHAD